MFLFQLTEFIWEVLPLLVLFFIFLIGYTLAYYDFKPKPVFQNEEFSNRVKPKFKESEIENKQRELTHLELGIDELNSLGAAAFDTQKEIKLANMIRSYSTESPDLTAEVIRAWLNEK